MKNLYKIHICYNGDVELEATSKEEAIEKLKKMTGDKAYYISNGTWEIKDSEELVEDDCEIIDAILTVMWDDCNVLDVPCKVNMDTHEITDYENDTDYNIRLESYEIVEEYLMIGDEYFEVIGYDEFCDAPELEDESFWHK